MDGKYFKMNGPCNTSAKGSKNAGSSCAHYYYVQSLQFAQGTPDADLGAVVADVTGLPDTNKVKIVARLRDGVEPGGFHNTFIYRHSDGHTYLVTTVNGPHTNVFDLGKVVSDPDSSHWKFGEFPVPETQTNSRLGRFGYHDFYLAYDPATHQDKFYGAGRGGYYVYDISDIKPAQAHHVDHRIGRYRIWPHLHTRSHGPLWHRRDRIPVRADSHFRPAARPDWKGANGQPPDRCVVARLAGPRPQP